MAKQAKSDQPEESQEARAWELFASRVMVGGQPTITHEGLVQECFKAVAAFEAVAKTEHRKGNQCPVQS